MKTLLHLPLVGLLAVSVARTAVADPAFEEYSPTVRTSENFRKTLNFLADPDVKVANPKVKSVLIGLLESRHKYREEFVVVFVSETYSRDNYKFETNDFSPKEIGSLPEGAKDRFEEFLKTYGGSESYQRYANAVTLRKELRIYSEVMWLGRYLERATFSDAAIEKLHPYLAVAQDTSNEWLGKEADFRELSRVILDAMADGEIVLSKTDIQKFAAELVTRVSARSGAYAPGGGLQAVSDMRDAVTKLGGLLKKTIAKADLAPRQVAEILYLHNWETELVRRSWRGDGGSPQMEHPLILVGQLIAQLGGDEEAVKKVFKANGLTLNPQPNLKSMEDLKQKAYAQSDAKRVSTFRTACSRLAEMALRQM